MIAKYLLTLFLAVFTVPSCFSQTGITGIWEGRYLSGFSNLGAPKLVVEIHEFKDSMFTGVSHLYYSGNMYEHYKVVGWFNKRDSLLAFREIATIAVDLGVYGNCLGNYIMAIKKKGNKLTQFGLWSPNIFRCTSESKVLLEKEEEEIVDIPVPVKKTPITRKPVPKVNTAKGKIIAPVITVGPPVPIVKETPVIKTTPIPSVVPEKITRRETDVQSLLEIGPEEKDSIKVEVYDNGEIDGDTVSVYEGQILRIDKKMIRLKPLVFYVSLNKKVNPITHLRLVAESLGSLPPCTALMIVTTKTKRYEVHLSSNFNKNATLELFLKE